MSSEKPRRIAFLQVRYTLSDPSNLIRLAYLETFSVYMTAPLLLYLLSPVFKISLKKQKGPKRHGHGVL
jgi:hypothetical protein